MYVLEGRVLFEPVNRRLCEDEHEVRLSGSVSRCLEQLILFQGKPVTRNELIERVWRQHGSVVTESSVRQTLHLLRKILSEFGLSEELIRTSRRQGYSIDFTRVSCIRLSLSGKFIKLLTVKNLNVLFTAAVVIGTLGYMFSALFFNAG